ncbi:putative A/G-specific adenine glycosylase YfhQ [Shimia sp. SK013]|uniref:A/G-specific adenine glycosylase n=1 Tax=Shimia sp. SK013 TaxID=1389006 RepID=UPI0006B68E55|nr:A/G-specific adenine glycosylase [Shimia sp. SK013]KPA21209.1 putative A/G-specific adenine glycosylase YfhQ [Shimia sp. SK013]
MRDQQDSTDLLEWYDRNARAMPWRVSPADRAGGISPDPYRVWLSEIMLQQTTVAAVKDYFERFTARWPTVQDLADAADEDVMAEWAGLGYYARARNLLKCARVIANEMQGQFPADYDDLLTLPGVGPYTAGAVSAIAFDRPATVVDGNVERVMARMFDVHTPLPAAKPELTKHAAALTPAKRPGDYAQAVMDLGATICTPRNPACGICPWRAPCKARDLGTATELPKKTPKKPKPIRYGVVYIAKRIDGAFLLERRPESGLLGGMLGWPGSEWVEQAAPAHKAPIRAEWKTLNGEARHTFTHFHLRLTVKTALVPMDRQPQGGFFVESETFTPNDLPTAMRKAFALVPDS